MSEGLLVVQFPLSPPETGYNGFAAGTEPSESRVFDTCCSMKDKSVAMSRGDASAWLIKHGIDAKAIKARRCIAFPPPWKYIAKRYSSLSPQRHDAMHRHFYSLAAV